MIKIIPVEDVQTQKEFVKFPFIHYRDDKNWIPPIIKDEYKIFKTDTNPALAFCEVQFWIAQKEGRTCGRVAAIINQKYNDLHQCKFGRISRIEFDCEETGLLLIKKAEEWIKNKGMDHVHGPLGFTNLDLQGLLIEGFDYLPSIASVYHKPFYAEVFDKAGYSKENDWVEFILHMEDKIPEKATRLAEMIKERYKLTVVHFKNRKELKPYASKLVEVLNDAFGELPYVTPFDEKTGSYYINKYFSFLNPDFVKVILNEHNKMIGFIVGLPSLSLAMKKANGKLFPFGFLHITRALKHPKVMDLVLTGVEPALQGQGIPALLINELQKVILQYGVKDVETTGMFETNQKAIQVWKNYNHTQHKRRRCYVKEI